VKRAVPTLITLDVHSYPEVESKLPRWLETTSECLNRLSIKATFFFPAVVAEKFSPQVRRLAEGGHEVGCHGLAHDENEQYHLDTYEKQKGILREAKRRIEQAARREVSSFRSPAFKINGDTIRALEDTGFKAESSVNPQRLGIFGSDVANVGWIYSPRRPYHPSFEDPFRRGGASLWEIPLSAFIFPFMSNSGMAFGGRFMQLFFNALYRESRLRSNPIVYMFHPEDICADRERALYKFRWHHLLPSRKMGFEVRNVLFHNKDPKVISSQIIGLLDTMKKKTNIAFVTYGGMLDLLENGKEGKR